MTGRRTYGVLTDSEGVTGVEVGYDDDEPFEDLYAVSCRRCQVEAPGGLFDAVAWELGVGA